MIITLKTIYYTVGLLLYGGMVISTLISCIKNRDLFKKTRA